MCPARPPVSGSTQPSGSLNRPGSEGGWAADRGKGGRLPERTLRLPDGWKGRALGWEDHR